MIDGGPTAHGLESSIVAVEGETLRLLRHGPITAEMLTEFATVRVAEASEHPEAPGQLKSHYAPRTPLRLVDEIPADLESPKIGVLAWRALENPERFGAVEILTPAGDLADAAATLFAKLRRLDEGGFQAILAEHVPERGLGRAIMDRLRKAQGT